MCVEIAARLRRVHPARMATSAIGVPVKLLKEAESHVITVELRSGEIYRGKLEAAEDTMNVQLSAVVHTARDGKVTKYVRRAVLAVYMPALTNLPVQSCRLENVFLRGSQVRFVVLPELLRHAPLFRWVHQHGSPPPTARPSAPPPAHSPLPVLQQGV